MNKDRVAARLLATFLGELDEQVRVMNADLLALEAVPGDGARLTSLFRVVHTLKGAARAVGVLEIEDACHELESLLLAVRDGRQTLGADQLTLLFASADALADAGERLRRGDSLVASPIARIGDLARTDPSAPSSGMDDRGAARGAIPDSRPPIAPPSAPARVAVPTTPAAPPASRLPVAVPEVSTAEAVVAPGAESPLRVHPQKLEALFDAAGELATAAGRVTVRAEEIRALATQTGDWAAEWPRLRRRLRLAVEHTRDAPELLRAIAWIEDGMRAVVETTGRIAVSATSDARAMEQAAQGTVDGVWRLRTRPVADTFESLPRVVRDLAVASGKEVRLEVQGGDVEADRAVLDALRDAVLHLVRNAVDHGIEPAGDRERAGKRRYGTVRVSAAARGDRILMTVGDDGAGVNLGAVRDRLSALGRVVPDDDREVARALFEPGLSTRAEATAISGRGVGLDIVRAAVDRVAGTVDLTWTPGAGTTVSIECPVSLARLRGVVATVGGQAVVIPTAYVARLLRVRPADVRSANGRAVIATDEGPVPLVTLARLLGPPLGDRVIDGDTPVVVLQAGAGRLAVAVDELVTEQEVVVRPIAHGRPRLPHLSGAAVLGGVRVALVMNPSTIVAAGLQARSGTDVTVATPAAAPRRPRILVVDDSITTRTLEQSVLEAAGYDVVAGVDGADGWRLLQERECDLVVADVEMPRMDGFALCEAIRASKRLARLPVVLVTALERPEHRARGLDVGADAYIGKSGFDQQHLLETIRQLLA